MNPRRATGTMRRVTGQHITLRLERPKFHHLQIMQPNQLKPRLCYLAVNFVDKLTVTLVRVLSQPRAQGKDRVVDIKRLVAPGLEIQETISLAKHSVISMGDGWSGSACLLMTAYDRLPTSGEAADRLSPADREILQKQVITKKELARMEEVEVDLGDS